MMAVYIEIERIENSGGTALFRFSTTDGRSGVFRLDLSSGNTFLEEKLPGDELGKLYARAAYKIRTIWRGGELPEKACWAS